MMFSYKRFLVYLLIGFCGIPALRAQQLSLSGQYRGEFQVRTADSTYAHHHWMNLVLERSLGQDAGMHLNLEFNNYGTSQIQTLIQEGYVNYYTSHIDWRFGKQIISWGSAYQIRPTDYFNPFDLTIITPGEKRLGVVAASGRYYAPARIEISAVFAPLFSTHQFVPQAGELLIRNVVQQTVAGLNRQVQGVLIQPDPGQPALLHEVRPTVDNTQGGLRVTKRGVGRFDVSVSAYRGRDKFLSVDEAATAASIYINPQVQANMDRFATVNLFYPRVHRLGLDVIGTLGKAGVWIDGTRGWYRNDQFHTTIDLAAGADYRFANNLYLMGQGLYIQARTEGEKDIQAVMLYGSLPVFGFHQVEMVGLYDFNSQSYFFQPQFNYSLGDAVSLDLGGTVVNIQDNPFAPIASQLFGNRLYARLRVDF